MLTGTAREQLDEKPRNRRLLLAPNALLALLPFAHLLRFVLSGDLDLSVGAVGFDLGLELLLLLLLIGHLL